MSTENTLEKPVDAQGSALDGENTRREMVIALFGLLKGLSLYDLKNAALQRPLQQMDTVLKELRKHLKEGQEFEIRVEDQIFYCLGFKVLSHFSIVEGLKLIHEAFEKSMIDRIVFEPECTAEAIGEFCSKWALHISVNSKPKPLQASVPGVRVQLIDPEKAKMRLKSKSLLMSPTYALEHYFLLRKHTEEFFRKIAGNEVISQKELRRELIEIMDILKYAPYQLVALSLIREEKEDPTGFNLVISQALATSLLSLSLARELNFSTKDQINIGLIGLIYNVGLVGEAAAAALKNDRLTPVEYKRITEAQASGVYKLLKIHGHSRPILERLLAIFEHSRGMEVKSVSLALESRLLRLVSQYVALTSDRPFRDAYTPQEAVKILGSKAAASQGADLDPILFYVFVRFLGYYPMGSLVLLSDNRQAVVYRPHGEQLGSPLVKLVPTDAQKAEELIDLSQKPDLKIIKALDPKREGIHIPGFFFS